MILLQTALGLNVVCLTRVIMKKPMPGSDNQRYYKKKNGVDCPIHAV
jgi:hypothetical protein